MNISVINEAAVNNKFIRLALWKLYALQKKFAELKKAELYIRFTEKTGEYLLILRLFVPGNDVSIRKKSVEIPELIKGLTSEAGKFLFKYQKVHQALESA